MVADPECHRIITHLPPGMTMQAAIPQEKIAFIDLDGVLADFFAGVCRVFNRPDLAACWPAGEYSCEKVLGITRSEFWRAIEADPHFWSSLAAYPWKSPLIDAVRSWGYRPFICTTPSTDPVCAAQKTMWIQDHLGSQWRDYCLCQDKHLLAAPNRILIDDKDENVDLFTEFGGTGILFPQRWNSCHEVHDGYRYVLYRLEGLP